MVEVKLTAVRGQIRARADEEPHRTARHMEQEGGMAAYERRYAVLRGSHMREGA